MTSTSIIRITNNSETYTCTVAVACTGIFRERAVISYNLLQLYLQLNISIFDRGYNYSDNENLKASFNKENLYTINQEFFLVISWIGI